MTTINDSRKFGPLDEARLIAFEAEFGATLPEEYRAFLLKHNGGRPVPANFRLSGDDASDVHQLYGLHDGPNYARLDAVTGVWRARLPEDLLPVGADSFGNQITIGMRGGRRGQVYFWDHVSAEAHLLAAGFRSFLERLFEWVDPNEHVFWKIMRTNDIGALRRMLAEGHDLEDKDECDRTLIENAAIWGRTAMVRVLVEAGAQLRSARDLAVQNGHAELVAYIDESSSSGLRSS